MVIAGIAMTVGGVVLVGLGAFARAGRLTRQWFLGLRTKATLASDEAWQAAHEAAANWVVGAGVVLFAGGVVVLLTDSETTGGVVALIATALMLLPLVMAYRRGQAAAQHLMDDDQPYVPPLSLLDVLEDCVVSGDPEDEFDDVVRSLGFSDRWEVADALFRYCSDERLSADQRDSVGYYLTCVWTNRGSLTWEAFDSLSGPARRGAVHGLPADLALKEAVGLLGEALDADVYDNERVEDDLWAIRSIKGHERDQVLAGLVSDERLSQEHRSLVAGFVDYTRRYNAAPGVIEPDSE